MSVHRKIHLLSFVLIALVFTSRYAMSQTTQKEKQDVDAQRVGFITKELELTPAEAQVFWPVYNKYRGEVDALRNTRQTQLLSANVNFDSFTDAQAKKLIDDEMDFRQKELDLRKKYNVEFNKILPVKKVAKLYRAEQLFKVHLIKETEGQENHANPVPPARK